MCTLNTDDSNLTGFINKYAAYLESQDNGHQTITIAQNICSGELKMEVYACIYSCKKLLSLQAEVAHLFTLVSLYQSLHLKDTSIISLDFFF